MYIEKYKFVDIPACVTYNTRKKDTKLKRLLGQRRQMTETVLLQGTRGCLTSYSHILDWSLTVLFVKVTCVEKNASCSVRK